MEDLNGRPTCDVDLSKLPLAVKIGNSNLAAMTCGLTADGRGVTQFHADGGKDTCELVAVNAESSPAMQSAVMDKMLESRSFEWEWNDRCAQSFRNHKGESLVRRAIADEFTDGAMIGVETTNGQRMELICDGDPHLAHATLRMLCDGWTHSHGAVLTQTTNRDGPERNGTSQHSHGR